MTYLLHRCGKFVTTHKKSHPQSQCTLQPGDEVRVSFVRDSSCRQQQAKCGKSNSSGVSNLMS